MTALEIILLVLLAVTIAVAAILLLRARHEQRRQLLTLNAMLDAVMRGDFHEKDYDESLLSAVETRMAHFLSAAVASQQNLTQEQDKIKELIADVSHQTKTPLANILLYSQLLAEQELPAESASCLAQLNEQAEKLRFLIGALVKTSRLEAGVFTLTRSENELQPLLAEVARQAAPKAAAKGVALLISPTEHSACFDPKWTAEALYNIVDNAIKYTPCGGQVSLAVQSYELFCRIDVSDTGCGIAEPEQAKVFARFYRSPAVSQSEGVGVGLYLARQIVTEEGGYIKLTSQLGKGSTFSVFLPRGMANLSKV